MKDRDPVSMSGEDVLQITHALLRTDTALAAMRMLRGNPDQAAVEGLVELLYHTRTAKEAVAAIAALEPAENPIVLDALYAALDNPHPSVRLASLQDLHRRKAIQLRSSVRRVLCEDESWPIRRAALHLLAAQPEPEPERWRVLDAVTDPHWRVRHALIRVLGWWGESEAERQEIDRRLTRSGTDARVQGVRAYLHYRWTGHPLEFGLPLEGTESNQACHFWDWDGAVLLRNLEGLAEKGRRQNLQAMPFLLRHTDDRIRGLAGKTLRDWGEISHLVSVVGLLDEPRYEGSGSIIKLLSELDLDRKEELARCLLRLSDPTPAQLAWALDQVALALPTEGMQEALSDLMAQAAVRQPVVRRALARLAARWEHPAAGNWVRAMLEGSDAAVQCEALRGMNTKPSPRLDPGLLRHMLDSEHAGVRAEAAETAVRQACSANLLEPLAADPDIQVRVRLAQGFVTREDLWTSEMFARLQADPHPHVRAAALTPARAVDLVEEPRRETSWHVLAAAARLARVPLWKLEPVPPWRPPASAPPLVEPLWLRAPVPSQAVPCGPNRLALAPVGISGHYGLPVHGFVRAYEAGVNLMFWEPNYQTMTEFITRLPPSDRGSIHLLGGTFEADGARVQRDAERVLRTLKVERVAIFLLFWVQSWKRVTPDVRAALERLKTAGKIGTYGLSTHSRALAIEALAAGWDPVMVRHSAAHRGAEEQVFPQAAERGTSVITFSNTCYGRLLKPRDGMPPPSAAECYRYTLMQPAVRACLSAPATLAELDENLAALNAPPLPEERVRYLEAFGAKLYEEEAMFRKCVRYL